MKKGVIRGIIILALVFAFAIRVDASVLTKKGGVNYYHGQKETYYNLPMDKVYEKADKNLGSWHKKWTRSDGVKMYACYVVLAVPFDVYPFGTTQHGGFVDLEDGVRGRFLFCESKAL